MYKSNPISREEIRRYVRKIRAGMAMEFTLPVPIVSILEQYLPIIFGETYNYEIVPEEEMGNKHGETIPDQGLIRIREDVYLGACSGNGRDRMTIAHEIGHFLLHRSIRVSLCRMENGVTEKPKVYENPEWQADVFAGELLAPSYLIANMSAKEISEKAKVSLAATETQLRHLPPYLRLNRKGGDSYD